MSPRRGSLRRSSLRRGSLRRAAVLLVVGLLLGTACDGGGGDEATSTTSTRPPRDTTGPTGTTSGALRWRACGDAECATLRAPLDHAQPDSRQIRLALARVKAGDPEQRLGVLVLNPGGPGAPGTGFVDDVARTLPDEITDRFDIVGWDPRGTGTSSPVRCGRRLDYLFNVDTAPDDPAEQAALIRASERFGRRCDRKSGDLIRHVATRDTAQDLELIRTTLGEEMLNFIGFSYGSYIGALYAEMFPDRVRTMVLDGAVDPAVPLADVSVQQAVGFEQSLDAFLADCARDEDCAFHHDGNPGPALEALRAEVDRESLVGDDGRELGPSRFDLALVSPLYAGTDGYTILAEALADAEDGDPAAMLDLADEYVGRDADGRYSNEWPAFLAISCLDGPALPADTIPALAARAERAAPVFGRSTIGLTLACSYWPVPPVNAQATPVRAPGAPPIMVIGTTGDPATPLQWSEGMAQELGSGRLVVVDGTSHTSALAGNACLDRALVRYLVDQRPPAPGLRCPA